MASAAEQLARNLNFATFSKAKVLQQRLLVHAGRAARLSAGHLYSGPGDRDPDAYAATFQQSPSQGIAGMFDLICRRRGGTGWRSLR